MEFSISLVYKVPNNIQKWKKQLSTATTLFQSPNILSTPIINVNSPINTRLSNICVIRGILQSLSLLSPTEIIFLTELDIFNDSFEVLNLKVMRRCGLIEPITQNKCYLFHGLEFFLKCVVYTMFDAKQKFMQIKLEFIIHFVTCGILDRLRLGFYTFFFARSYVSKIS